MSVAAIVTYRPVWDGGRGGRVRGHDEDVVTLAVSAARPLLAATGGGAQRVVLVTREPDFVEASTAAVLSTALGLGAEVVVEERLGGGPAVLQALADAPAGTLVVGVSPSTPAGSAAALVGEDGAALEPYGGVERSLPARVRSVASAGPVVYDDPRLVREAGLRPALAAVADGTRPAALTGLPRKEAGRFGVEDAPEHEAVEGAAEPLFALAALLEGGRSGLLVAVEGASAFAVEIGAGAATVVRAERPAVPPQETALVPARIPLSLAAYARAFDAKVGLRAARCACGALSYPPRVLCLSCGRTGETSPVELPRTGEVYSTVTVRTPVPGVPGPYSLAIVAFDGVEARLLAPVTGAPAGSVRIGDHGGLVLRRVALRDGVPDYGYAFEPDEVRA